MSGTVLRRSSSSKQGLHNLLRLTTQRSIEDAEEIEREHRRRAREAARACGGGAGSCDALQENVPQPENTAPPCENSVPQSAPKSENSVLQSKDNAPQSEDPAPKTKERVLDAGLKPCCQATLEEDEGFSDWTLKLGGNRQHHPAEQSPESTPNAEGNPLFPTRLASRQQQEEEEKKDECEMKESEGSGEQEQREERDEEDQGMDTKKRELDAHKKQEKGEEKQTKVTYVSSLFLQQETRHITSNGDAAGEETTLCTITTERTPRSPSVVEEVEDDSGEVEVKVKMEVERSSQREKGRQEQEQLWRRPLEAEAELEELRKRREERRRAREEDDCRREEEEHQWQVQEEEDRRQMRAEIERRRMEAAERMKNLKITEGEEPFSPVIPKSPTFKNETEARVTAEHTSSIIERTESLNQSLKKNKSVKMLPLVMPVSTIDGRLKKYTHALETSSREDRQTLAVIPSSPEPVASKKSLFEAGEAWSQSATKNLQYKGADGLKVDVADRISHWVKGNPESCGRKSPSKPSNVRVGDVMYKKNLWESVRASASGGSEGKGSLCGKRYTFVVTGHGKYEKMPINGDDHEHLRATSTGLSLEEP